MKLEIVDLDEDLKGTHAAGLVRAETGRTISDMCVKIQEARNLARALSQKAASMLDACQYYNLATGDFIEKMTELVKAGTLTEETLKEPLELLDEARSEFREACLK